MTEQYHLSRTLVKRPDHRPACADPGLRVRTAVWLGLLTGALLALITLGVLAYWLGAARLGPQIGTDTGGSRAAAQGTLRLIVDRGS